MPRPLLTSTNSPLQIAEVPMRTGNGMIGITFAPGKKQPHSISGHHDRDLGIDLDRIAAWNAAIIVTLMEAHELEKVAIANIGAEVRRRHMEWHHWPIVDVNVPDADFEAGWPDRSAKLRTVLACGGRVLIHCRGGIGRSGMLAARLLVESGVPALEAIAEVRTARPHAVETPDQERWVAAGRPTPLLQPPASPSNLRDRAVGAMIGLAVGDALGAAIEFQTKPHFALLDDMRDGGPHHLKRGQWTDDTAMALALADSLLHDPALDANDLMTRFQDWYEGGIYSCTGTCFDIGNTTRSALMRFKRDHSPLAGSSSASASGNGALMRLAPVAVCHWSRREEMLRVAELQTRTTHGSPATLTASATFAAMLANAIAGQGLADILAGDAASRIDGGWRGLHRDRIQGSGYVVKSLQAAVWAVSRTTDFRSAVLLAANLGDDADTTAAIAGQLAGAVYGLSGIPGEWLEVLAWRERLEQTAQELFELGQQDTDSLDEQPATIGDAFAAPWMTGDWTLRERLTALAAFEPIISAPGFRAATFRPGRPDGDMIVLGGYVYGRQAMRFIRMAYAYGWVRKVYWMEWSDTPRGKALFEDPGALATANEDDLAAILTTCIWADRFCDGAFDATFENGLILRVVTRARELLEALPFGGSRSMASQ